MHYVNFGESGLKDSRIALGMMTYGSPLWRPWVLDAGAARRIRDRDQEAYFPVDLAVRGANEAGPKPSIRPNQGEVSRKHIFAAADASLKRLGCDYIDPYQIHRFDADTPVGETTEALHVVVQAGKAR
jgi:aryl-alcohol dehydrogenase-like predicted oxidoreductase